jgi:hypothetical protein
MEGDDMTFTKTASYPAIDLLTKKAAAAQSVATALIELAKAGRLGELERDIAAMRRDISSGRVELVKRPANGLAKSAGTAAPEAAEALAKAFDYQQMARRVADQAEAASYRELAAAELRKAGVS